jgi:hypothetical protein
MLTCHINAMRSWTTTVSLAANADRSRRTRQRQRPCFTLLVSLSPFAMSATKEAADDVSAMPVRPGDGTDDASPGAYHARTEHRPRRRLADRSRRDRRDGSFRRYRDGVVRRHRQQHRCSQRRHAGGPEPGLRSTLAARRPSARAAPTAGRLYPAVSRSMPVSPAARRSSRGRRQFGAGVRGPNSASASHLSVIPGCF